MIISAVIAPHPPIILPNIGSDRERSQVPQTIKSLNALGVKMAKEGPEEIIISSPHPDWGFEVPLYFLTRKLSLKSINIDTFITRPDPPREHFEAGKNFYHKKLGPLGKNKKIAIIASGDLSHCLKIDGPYGLHPDGKKFDKELIEALKNKDTKRILTLDDRFPEAGECGLRSFSFALGILEAANIKWQPQIMSYEFPFGVGYLVCDLIGNN